MWSNPETYQKLQRCTMLKNSHFSTRGTGAPFLSRDQSHDYNTQLHIYIPLPWVWEGQQNFSTDRTLHHQSSHKWAHFIGRTAQNAGTWWSRAPVSKLQTSLPARACLPMGGCQLWRSLECFCATISWFMQMGYCQGKQWDLRCWFS